jgi:hypothetical protein
MLLANQTIFETIKTFDCAFFNVNQLSIAQLSTRQTALEHGASGVDRAMTWSFWARPSNFVTDGALHILRISETASSTAQMTGIIIQDSSVDGGKFRFTLNTDASNFIYIQSAAPLKKNRWTHVMVTYDGTEANTGLEMYLNSVIESSPTRNLTGTYTGAYSSANLRFQIGRTQSVSPQTRYAGFIRDIAFFDIEADQTQVNESFNGGIPKDVDELSFYSDIIAYWPLRSALTCLNSATFNLGDVGSTGIVYRQSFISPNRKTMSIKRAEPASTRYIAFCGSFKTSGNLMSTNIRSGTSHVLNGKIVKYAIDFSTEVVTAPVDIITDGTYDLRGGSAGVINGTVYNFYSRYNGGSDVFIDSNRNPSTDGLTGVTYAGATTMATVRPRYNFYGKVIAGFSAGHYFVPQFENTTGTVYTLNVWKTEDNGSTWNITQVWDAGTEDLSEPAMINLGIVDGNPTLLILCRRVNGGGLTQIVSTTGGATWGSAVDTNLGVGQCNCDMELDRQGRLVVAYMDRADNQLYLSTKNYIDTILASPTSYVTPAGNKVSYSTDSLGILGYPNLVRTKGNLFALLFSLESSSSRADLFFGHGSIIDNDIQHV